MHPCRAVYSAPFPNGVELSLSRQDFRPIRFNLKRQTLASFVYVGGGLPFQLAWPEAKFCGAYVSHHFVSFSRSNRRRRRRFDRECFGPA